MSSILLSEEEHRNLLTQRETPLTRKQQIRLRELEQCEMILQYLNKELGIELTWFTEYIGQSLRNQQREILLTEKEGRLNRLASFSPEQLNIEI